MGLKDSTVRWLALRYLKGKIKNLRGKDKETGMGKVLKFLDGWKLVIFVVLMAGAKWWDMAHNGHAGDTLGVVLQLLGYTQGADWMVLARDLAIHAGAVVAIAHKVVKAQRQARAGASTAGLLSPEGYVAEAVVKVGGTPDDVKGAIADVRASQ